MGDDQGRVGDLSLDRVQPEGALALTGVAAQMTPAIGTPGWSIVVGCVATQTQNARTRVREAQLEKGNAQDDGSLPGGFSHVAVAWCSTP